MPVPPHNQFRAQVRRAVADLLAAQGCSCCRDNDGWDAAIARLAKLLRAPQYSDGSGYDFRRFKTKDGVTYDD